MSVQQVSEYVDARSQQERLEAISDLRDPEREAQRMVTNFDPDQVIIPPGTVRRNADAATRQQAQEAEVSRQRSELVENVSRATRAVVLEEQKQLKLVPRDA